MSQTLNRLLKIAAAIRDSGDSEELESFYTRCDAFFRKHAHMVPHNDGTTPNPWRRNMDYSEFDRSPYYGSVSEFMEKFPGGIREWVEWRDKSRKDRYKRWDIQKRTAYLETLMKDAYFAPAGGDDVKKYEQEEHLYSGEGLEKFKSVKEYIEKRRKDLGLSADDTALSAVKDFIAYWKLLLKGKEKRKKARKGRK